jgi:glutaredoxin 3
MNNIYEFKYIKKNRKKNRKNSRKNSIKNDRKNSIKNDRKNSIKNDRKNSIKNDRKNSIKNDRKNKYKEKHNILLKNDNEYKLDNINEWIIYTIVGCPYCEKAKDLLNKNNIKYKIITVNNDNKSKVHEYTNSFTNSYKYFPMIFKKKKFIGGYQDLKKIFKDEKNVHQKDLYDDSYHITNTDNNRNYTCNIL